ncbi:hypothetical protein [Micromonospora sp. NPDC049102]|uniref:hypothetical protein n=1 Tax=Micromonospora sp. NPDC049102 TaxID=3364265 RepID=UPI0037201279
MRKAMDKFQQRNIAELRADKGLHLQSVTNARDPGMRTIRIWRRVCRRLDLPWTEQFLAHEFRHVILAHDVQSREEYRAAGRRALGPRQRDRGGTPSRCCRRSCRRRQSLPLVCS